MYAPGSYRQLDLCCNFYMSGPIPATIGQLSGLQHLNLQSMGLTGSIPSTISNLGSVKYGRVRVGETDLLRAHCDRVYRRYR